MTDDHLHASPGEDFLPEDYLEAVDGGPPIREDFVDRTLARVIEDQCRIRDEAARVDDIGIRPEVLAVFAEPTPSDDFVERTLGRIRAARSRATAVDASVHDLLAGYEVPPVSADFVERILAVLRVDAVPAPAGLRIVRGARRTSSKARFAVAAAAVIALSAVLVIAVRDDGSAPPPETIAASPEFSPATINTAFARLEDRADGGLRFEPVDSLLMLAAAAEGRGD